MAGQVVECQVCKTVSKSELKGSTLISFVLFWFFAIIPGIIYMIWRRGGGICANCKSSAVIPYVRKPESLTLKSGSKIVAHDAYAYHAGNKVQTDENGVEQKHSPDCHLVMTLHKYDCAKLRYQ